MARGLDETPDAELPDPRAVPVDLPLLVEEAKLGCLSAMLMCLDRRQRLAFVLGELLGAPGAVAAEVLDVSHANYRQLRSRARRDLTAFMSGSCGLLDPRNPCRCARKTAAFIEKGYVDPDRLQFAEGHRQTIRERVADATLPGDVLERAAVELFRDQPFHEVSRAAERLRALLEHPDVRRALDGADPPNPL